MKRFSWVKLNEEGAAIIEFAIILPLFLIFVFGIIEFGAIMYNKAMITNASREGARFGILFEAVSKTQQDITDRVEEVLGVDSNDSTKSKLLSLGGSAEPEILFPNGFPPSDGYLAVEIRYPYDFLFVPSFLPGLPDTLTINTTTTMRME